MDNICVSNADAYCMTNFTFLTLTEQENMPDIEGIIGIAPDDPANGPCDVASLYNANKLGQKVFGIAFQTMTILFSDPP